MDTRLEKLLNENFDEFMIEIGREELLSREEELAFITAAQEKGLECEEADRLEKANLRFVVGLSARYQNRGLSLAELITMGAEELRRSILSYDLNKDTKFIGHFVALLRVCFEDAISNNNDIKRKMLVRELHMREYYNEEIDDYNTAFSFVVDFDRKRYTVGELFCDCTYSIDEVERYIVKYLMARTEHDESKLYWQMVENSQLNKETEKITKIQDE